MPKVQSICTGNLQTLLNLEQDADTKVHFVYMNDIIILGI